MDTFFFFFLSFVEVDDIDAYLFKTCNFSNCYVFLVVKGSVQPHYRIA